MRSANREFLIYGDEGIHAQVGQDFWGGVRDEMAAACGKCRGLWLDAGEFAAIHEARLQMEKDPPAEEPAEPDGVKGALIWIIDAAIEHLRY